MRISGAESNYLNYKKLIYSSKIICICNCLARRAAQPGALSRRLFHGATPETDDTCFYFWMRANSIPDDPRSTEVILEEIAAVLSQDIAILEAQNDRMMADLDRRLVDLKNDSQRIMARRAVDRMIAAEQAVMRWPRRSDPAIDEGRALPPSPSGYPMIALYPSVPMK